MYKKFDDFQDDVTSKIIEAVRTGGDSNVYIVLKNGILFAKVASIHSFDKIEFNGEGKIVHTIECKSYGDMGYEHEEDFIEADAEYHFIDSNQDTLKRIFLYYSNNPLYKLLTLQEAALIWRKDSSTLRRVLQGPKFTEEEDFRKSEKPWLIKKDSMERVYGIPNFQEKEGNDIDENF